MSKSADIRRSLLEGLSYDQIVSELEVSKPTISYHAKKLGLSKSRSNSDYDWKEISDKLNSGMTLTAASSHYGFHMSTFDKALKSGKVEDKRKLTSRMNASEYSLLYKDTPATSGFRSVMKKKLALDGKEEKCDNPECGITHWLGQKAPLELDHIDGNSSNNILENLRFLCLHCHSQTDTWRGRNTRKQRDKRIVPG